VRFDARWLGELPWCSDVTSILETVEATAVSDRFSGAGQSAGEPARLGIHAASWRELQYQVSGFDMTDPERGGVPLILLPRLALEDFRLQSAALGVRGAGPGALLALEPLQPGPKWRGRLAANLAPAGLQTDVKAGSAPPIARLRDGHELAGVVSGPLAGERLGATFAGEWERADRSERGAELQLRGERKSALGQLRWTPRPSDDARLLLAGHELRRPFVGRARLLDGGVGETERAFFSGTSWRRRTAGGRELMASASFAARGYDPPAETGPAVALERLDSGPIAEAVAEPSRLRVLRAEVAFAPAPRATGALRHEPRAVARGEWSRLTTKAAPGLVVGELVDGRAARAWSFSEAGPARRSDRRLSLALQDRLTVPDRLDGGFGVRYDAQAGSRPDAPGLISWTDFSPHAGLLVRPLRGLPVFVHAGFARYSGRLPLQLLEFSDPAARSANVVRWTDPDRDGIVQPRERAGPVVARTGPGGGLVSVDPRLAAPRTTEYTAGLVFERGPARLTFSGVHRTTRGLPETVNTGVLASGYRVLRVADPGLDLAGPQDDQLLAVFERSPSSFGQDRYLLTNPAGHDVTQQGVELALELSPGERLRIRLGGTASKTTGAGANRGFRVGENDAGSPGELFDDPNADSFDEGRMFFDRAYTLKLAGVYRSRGWGMGAVARYQDGQPFARVVIAEGLAQGPEIVPAVRRGDHRFTYILTVDARVERSLELGRWRATAAIEAFSLFRQRREVEEYAVWGPDFRAVTAAQPPRALRLGLRLDF
jgi:hypothetical protein